MTWSESFASFLQFRVPVPLSEWADAHRIIPAQGGAEPGRWRTSRTPYLRRILDAVTDPAVSQITVCSGIQLGKTEILLNTVAYHMLHDPASILLVEPSDDLVSDIGEFRIDPMIMTDPALRDLFGLGMTGDKSTKNGKLKTYSKNFPGGFLKLGSAAAPSDLVSRSVRIILCDEIDKYAPLSLGHPVDMAIGRSTNFPDAKIVLTSSPSDRSTSEIWRRFSDSAQFEYRIPCPACGHAFTWTWKDVQWDGTPDTARLVCPECSSIVRDSGAAPSALLARGDWDLVEGDPACGRYGFRMSSLMSPWKTLSGLVGEWLAANRTRDIDRLKTFVTDRLAEPWDDTRADWGSAEHTSDGRFESTPDHSTIRFLTAGVDVQRNRIEVSVWGFADNGESWVLRHEVFMGDALSDGPWNDLLRFLAEPIALCDGRKGRVFAACIDSGDGYSTHKVYHVTARLVKHRIVPIKGVGGEAVSLISRSSTPYRTPLYRLGVDRIKRVIYERLGIAEPGPGYIHVPEELSESYWLQLTAEVPTSYVDKGRKVTRWRKVRNRNEALDCAVYALAAYELFCSREGLAAATAAPVHGQKRS